MGSPGHGVDPSELRELKTILNTASDELGMTNFKNKASLEGFLTTQSVSPYENVEETVEQLVLKLSDFANRKYPAVVEAMHDFIVRSHVTITTMAEGVSDAGKEYEITEEQIQEWMDNHPT